MKEGKRMFAFFEMFRKNTILFGGTACCRSMVCRGRCGESSKNACVTGLRNVRDI